MCPYSNNSGKMLLPEFVKKWQKSKLRERSASQSHFIDLCTVLGEDPPTAVDLEGGTYTFDKGAEKNTGEDGFADVWKRRYFGWEYKSKHKDLNEAYQQLLKYREALENPPLLVLRKKPARRAKADCRAVRIYLRRMR